MGWSNYIIISDLKLAVEANRNVRELENYIKESLESSLAESAEQLSDMDEVKVNEFTLRDLKILYTAYERMESIAGIEHDKLLLYWLEDRGINYEIKSEHQINLEDLRNNGFNIIRLT